MMQRILRHAALALASLALFYVSACKDTSGVGGGPGAATKLAFTVQPSNTTAKAAITPGVQVTVQDASGNTVTSATNSVTIAIGTNSGSGTLSGTATVAAVNGVATFNTLTIDKVGTGYTLAA